jgi:hypothetical protein
MLISVLQWNATSNDQRHRLLFADDESMVSTAHNWPVRENAFYIVPPDNEWDAMVTPFELEDHILPANWDILW